MAEIPVDWIPFLELEIVFPWETARWERIGTEQKVFRDNKAVRSHQSRAFMCDTYLISELMSRVYEPYIGKIVI